MPETKRIEQPNVLIVEGADEVNLFRKLRNSMGVEKLQILGVGGKDKIRVDLELIANDLKQETPLVASIGIIRDADQDPKAAFQSVQAALKKWDLPVPNQVLEPAGERPCVRIMILPGFNRKGSLETLCIKSVGHDPAATCVEEYVQCLRKNKIKLPANLDKTRAYTFMASRQVPEDEIGVGAQKSYWNLDSSAFDEVKNFIRLVVSGADLKNKPRKNRKDI